MTKMDFVALILGFTMVALPIIFVAAKVYFH